MMTRPDTSTPPREGAGGVRGQSGVALIATLAIVVIVATLVLGSALTTQLELTVTRNDVTATQAQYLAQAGLQTAKAFLFQSYREVVMEGGGTDPCASGFGPGIPFFRNGVEFSFPVEISEFVYAESGQLIGQFTAVVPEPVANSVYTVQSTGRTLTTEGGTETARSAAFATFVLSTGSGLEQAIFAGAGSGMQMINGNAEIYGGIYIEGDRDEFLANGTERVVVDLNGTFRLYNGYSAADLRQGSYNPTDFLTESDVANLCASLRVAYGAVAVGGSVELGKPDNKIYTVAVGSGPSAPNVTYNGEAISGDVDGTCRRNRGVCSIDGVAGFDLQDAPRFPRLYEPPANEDLCPGAATWRDCIRSEAGADGITLIADPLQTDVQVPAGLEGNTSCLDALNGAFSAADLTLRLDATEVDCTYVDDDGATVGFRYTPGSPNEFATFGNVNIRGLNLRFERDTRYTSGGLDTNSSVSVESIPPGTATTAAGAGGNIHVNSSFTPQGASKFPDEVIALVAERMLTINGGNQTTVTAPVYAGELFRIRANSVLAGQVIANEFCSMGSPNSTDCNNAGAPPKIIYSSSSGNRPNSYSAVATPGGTPTFRLLGYEQR